MVPAFRMTAFRLLGPIVGARPLPRAPSAAANDARIARFDALFEQYYAFVWRTVRRLGVPDAGVDDAVQEVFLVVARRLDEIEHGMEKSFMFGTTRRVAAVARRAEKAQDRVDLSEALREQASADKSPEEALAFRRAQMLLASILASMDDEVREAFVLFELEGLTKPEVAELLGIAEGTAASRLRRGREIFLAGARRIRMKMEGEEMRGRIKP